MKPLYVAGISLGLSAIALLIFEPRYLWLSATLFGLGFICWLAQTLKHLDDL